MSDQPGRYVMHVPFTASDLVAAKAFARAAGRSLSYLPELDPGETTVSLEDAQGVRHRVFCDRRLGAGRRCVLPIGHALACAPAPGT
ncbi:hypothetical protein SAMN05444365_105176 [Micromonospora pattaloongensis]|uniref:Uncharacterized protein n=1 Tax=Micromonospora pattaloongensis TaxID=405436 RepID=A0A1H3Q1U9_9ACTN|nr:hypothetical protein [Micromonospora pattaloongensis]SDZ07336.1 hypothetical protein SAMN05444365_105176 [Micromonospora pattaloongensis]